MPPKAKSTKSPPIKIEKSRTVKRNYQRRKQGFKFSSQQLRQIERNEVLQKRADKIKDKEKRAKLNKQKKDEKERKAREERLRLGIPEPGVKVDPAQRRLSQLFGVGRKVITDGGNGCSDVEEEVEEEDGCEDEGLAECEELERPPPADPVTVYEDADADEDSEMLDDAEDILRDLCKEDVQDPWSPSQLSRKVDHGAGQPKTPSKLDLGLADDWEAYITRNSQLERGLAGDTISTTTEAIEAVNTHPTTEVDPLRQPLNRKVLTPKAPSSKLNIVKQDVAAQVIAMISNQDLASDKENLDPAKPSPDEKAADYKSSSKKSKRSHHDALSDGDKENVAPKAKQLKRNPLEDIPTSSEKGSRGNKGKQPSGERKVQGSGSPLSKAKPTPKAPQPQVTVPQSSSQDEYSFNDFDGLEADLIAEVEKAESLPPRAAFEPSFSQDEYGWADLDGMQEELIAKVEGVESAADSSTIGHRSPSFGPQPVAKVQQSSSQEYGLNLSRSFDATLLAEADSFETAKAIRPTEVPTPSQDEYGLSRSPSFESALLDELDRHTLARLPPSEAKAPEPSSQDEYGSTDFDRLEAELIAKADGLETQEGLKALGTALSSQEWFRDLMGTQELRDIGLG
jgi:hypothetical protein